MLKAKISLCLNYFIVALLLNSVAVFVIQMSSEFHASQEVISTFAPFKDFATLIASFIFAGFIPRMGIQKTTLLGMGSILIACVVMGIHPSIASSFVFFILLGVSFSLIKVATYASVLSLTNTKKEHTSFVSLLEGCFMLGILSMSWIFGVFEGMGHWSYTFWILGGLTFIAILLYLSTTIDDKTEAIKYEEAAEETHKRNWPIFKILLLSPIVWIFILLAICDVFIETGLSIWLPSFDHTFLNINTAIAIEILSLFSASLALGRLIFSFILKKVKTFIVLVGCMAISAILFIIAMFVIQAMPPIEHLLNHWGELPTIAFWLPLTGFFIAPIYPTLCSVLLTAFPENHYQSPAASLIVIFSAVGGMAGAALLGYIFNLLGPAKGIALPAIPMLIMLALIVPYFVLLRHKAHPEQH